ncbi:Tok1p [Lachancea thermotolerans CBS 6340]|uniref:KLTH0D03476p n=1 Tax=Lachancea thermotolerans (strain ATCC 56472 / CBS 6340 / NRRL Y-8284) TaxID=559295 RepID=C5DG96_LACTC|nr:KLTH0D03476p [Lachancea thermotolerans CBS 6340]CAR22438.1 KLTH0D03476p [Lachancea thermotolerans CBS 6340]
MVRKNSSDAEREYKRLLDESLSFNRDKVIILNAEPSSRSFVIWFIISSYFPVITACLGPISNTIAVAGIVGKWRADAAGKTHPDPKGVYAVNVVSLALGCVSNFVLLLHFSKRVGYIRAQLTNIVGWTLAGGLLLADVIVCSQRDFPPNLQRTVGFWYASFTVLLYFGSTVLLSIHYCGYKAGKYPAKFNLTDSERNVMIFTFVLSIWFIWGSAMFSKLIEISFDEALYFCTVSILTIGLGDIVPLSVSAKIMTLVYSMSGVIILGLIVALTRSILQSSSGPILFFNRVETARTKVYEKLIASGEQLEGREAFEVIKNIRKVSVQRQKRWSVLSTLVIFIAFWLLGALVFHFAERWNYFNCLYFCFLCLITIGFGDYAPKTGCGRAFFVIWAICAVPLMTAIINTVGETLHSMSSNLEINIAKSSALLLSPVFSMFDKICSFCSNSPKETQMDHSVADEHGPQSASESQAEGNGELLSIHSPERPPSKPDFDSGSDSSIDSKIATKLKDYLQVIKWLRELSHRKPDSKLDFDEWARLFSSISDDGDRTLGDPHFWVSEDSPLRYPIDEPRYVMHNLLINLENDIERLVRKNSDEA